MPVRAAKDIAAHYSLAAATSSSPRCGLCSSCSSCCWRSGFCPATAPPLPVLVLADWRERPGFSAGPPARHPCSCPCPSTLSAPTFASCCSRCWISRLVIGGVPAHASRPSSRQLCPVQQVMSCAAGVALCIRCGPVQQVVLCSRGGGGPVQQGWPCAAGVVLCSRWCPVHRWSCAAGGPVQQVASHFFDLLSLANTKHLTR